MIDAVLAHSALPGVLKSEAGLASLIYAVVAALVGAFSNLTWLRKRSGEVAISFLNR
jgi:hypothetical protein